MPRLPLEHCKHNIVETKVEAGCLLKHCKVPLPWYVLGRYHMPFMLNFADRVCFFARTSSLANRVSFQQTLTATLSDVTGLANLLKSVAIQTVGFTR